MSIYEDDLRPLGLEDVSTYALADRQSKVTIKDFARPVEENASLRDFLGSLPNILAVQSLRELAAQITRARELQKPIIWGRGHVISLCWQPSSSTSCGGFVTGVARTGQFWDDAALRWRSLRKICATLGAWSLGAAEETVNF